MKSSVLLCLLPLALAGRPLVRRENPAPLIKPRGATIVADKYIVKIKGDSDASALNFAIDSFAAEADNIYKMGHKFRGFRGTLTPEEIEILQHDPNVEWIEHDAEIVPYAYQEDAPWGLARLSSIKPGSTTYGYHDTAGEGTCAYVLDTGVEVDHEEFEGRAVWLANTVDNDDTDSNGHGTHVAGTIGSRTYGVAKRTSIFSIKVLGVKGGSTASVLAGMDMAVADSRKRDCPNGVVVNMSLGGGVDLALNQAAAAIVDAGIFLAVAAGNNNTDANSFSPASETSACTVGATTWEDVRSEFSNYGSVVDIFAPGSDITSTWPGGEVNTISGTSMASPHIAGLAALLLSAGVGPTDPEELCHFIATTGHYDIISDVPYNTVNILAYNGLDFGSQESTDKHRRRRSPGKRGQKVKADRG